VSVRAPFSSPRFHLLGLTLLLLVLLGVFLGTELRLTGGRLGVPLDDAWIHYQFARNLVEGNGFSFNPGEPTPGSTAPLWTLILAATGLFTSDYLVPSLVLSVFFLLIVTWLTYGFTLKIAGENGTFWAFMAGLGVILTGRMLWAGLAGMETTAFAAVSLAAVWSYHRHGLRPLSALLFALGGQLRPEGHALFALAVGLTIWTNRHTLRKTWPTLPTAVLIYGLIAAPYALFSLFTTGRPLPNTFYAKAGSEHLFSWRALTETVAYHWQDNPVAFLLIPFGLIVAAKRSRLLMAWLVALPLLTAIIVDFIWHHGRYTLPLVPFQMIAAALGAAWLAQSRFVRSQRLPPAIQRAVPAILMLLVILGGAWRLSYWAGMLGYNSNEILEIDGALGHWLVENTPPDALIAVDDIGAITFISQRRILDLYGLVSPEMWPVIRGEAEGRPRNEATVRLLSSIQPDYLAIFPVWHWEIATNPVVAAPRQRFWVETHSIIGEQEAIVYEMSWPYQPEVTPQVSQAVGFGESIQLLGYDFAPPATLDQPAVLALYWQSLALVTERYDVFVHLLDESGSIVAQEDQEPVAGMAPTHRWQPGDIIRDPYTIFLPADLLPGPYRVSIGMYLRTSGARLPVDDTNAADNALYLTSFVWPPVDE
jgi:arabinofuranosyltransferase